MRKGIILGLICVIVALLVFGCGGEKKLIGDYLEKGIPVSYKPAQGQKVFYRSNADNLTEFTEQGYHQSTLSKTTSWESFTVDSVENEITGVTYKFLGSETGIFQNGMYQPQREEDDIIGQELSIIVDTDGKLIGWFGLEDLERDESGVDRGEMMASNYASIFFDHFPQELLKIGSEWVRENAMDVNTKEGDMHQMTKKIYTVQDFVEKDGHPCVKCKIKIIIDNTGEGTVDNEGTTYHYYNEGRGEGNGTVYFDFKAGYPIYSMFNWILDFTITSVDESTQEENSFSYYQEQKVTYHLITESDIPVQK
ncbi:hypothetical protein KAH81_05480 [bacterium]|nr:hypothetical protein [bacterium]